MLFKDISYLELWQPFVQQSQTVCAILVEGIMRFKKRGGFKDSLCRALVAQQSHCACLVEGTMGNIPVKLFQIWTSDLEVVI